MIDTHYFSRPPGLDADTFSAFVDDVRKCLEAAPDDILLAGRDGRGDAEITSNCVAFNGHAAQGDHEPLIIEQTYTLRPPSRMRDGVYRDFCKTNSKPYDLIVVAVLYSFIYHFPACQFTSDSSIEELKPGFDLFFSTCCPRGDLTRLFRRPVCDRYQVA